MMWRSGHGDGDQEEEDVEICSLFCLYSTEKYDTYVAN